MPAVSSSIITGATALVRIRETVVYLRGRRLSRFGPHGSLVELGIHDALRLVETGQAKLAGGIHRQALRDAVAATA